MKKTTSANQLQKALQDLIAVIPSDQSIEYDIVERGLALKQELSNLLRLSTTEFSTQKNKKKAAALRSQLQVFNDLLAVHKSTTLAIQQLKPQTSGKTNDGGVKGLAIKKFLNQKKTG